MCKSTYNIACSIMTALHLGMNQTVASSGTPCVKKLMDGCHSVSCVQASQQAMRYGEDGSIRLLTFFYNGCKKGWCIYFLW